MERPALGRPAIVLATAAAAILTTLVPGAARAETSDPIMTTGALLARPVAPDGSRIVDFTIEDDRNLTLSVYSAAMGRPITITVQRPADTSAPRPTLYLLSGADGGEGTANWDHRTPEALRFLGTKDVNVVQPIGGAWSYYTDWRAPDPVLGVHKWKTFFTEELPPVIDGALGTNGLNAIAGLSTSGTSVLQLPIAAPGLFRAAAAYSGCAQISDPIGYSFVNLSVGVWGGGNTDNMYGPRDDPMWAANDPYVNAEGLRGVELFISSGTGLPGRYDMLNGPYTLPGLDGLASQVITGGVIEAGVNYCSHNLQAKLNSLGIPATYDFPPTGTHSWGYWLDALKASWPVLARGLELPE
ncbi:alpha/beta hydrolase [Nocardia amikacinitolerans]|uniref:alpha/beta hydrolase n=1 Tax=Nocardia amikacinitolerans TaxID=756689 RepID=UPI00368952F5